MATTKQRKEEILKEITDKLSKIKAAVFADYRGLSVEEITNLRSKLRESGIDMKVAKKSLIRLALEKVGIKNVPPEALEGPVAMALSYEDEVLAAKIIHDFDKKEEKLQILGGIFNGSGTDRKQMLQLASLPAKEVLQAQVVYGIAAPLSGIANVLFANIRNLAYVVKAIQDNKEGNN